MQGVDEGALEVGVVDGDFDGFAIAYDLLGAAEDALEAGADEAGTIDRVAGDADGFIDTLGDRFRVAVLGGEGR